MRAVRGYFEGEGFWEAETPILQTCPVMDTHIHAFKTALHGPDMAYIRDFYLHTSPEFAMKKLLVAGMPRIFQICHVFRNGDHSHLHRPEFTMLEWYRAQAGYLDVIEDSIGLLRHVANSLGVKDYKYKGLTANPFESWLKISVAEAFQNYAGIKLGDYLEDTPAFSKAVAAQNIRTADGDRWDDLFFRVMAEKIEPHLGAHVPAVLYDYPASMASLARKKPDDPRYAERFEIYVCGVELCNGFGELTDAAEQRARFTEEMALKKKLYGEDYPVDEDFIRALEYGLPDSGGNAMGLDRLVMLATGAEDIRQVLWTEDL